MEANTDSMMAGSNSAAFLDKPKQGQGAMKGRGGWKTMPFILGNEICERMGSLSVLWNLVPYLYAKYNMTYVRAAYIVNAISGTCSLTPIAGAILADSCFGRFWTITVSSVFTLMGLILLTVTAVSKILRPPHCNPSLPQLVSECPQASTGQLLFLLTSFGFIAIGSGGLRPCTYPFGADQFEATTVEEKKTRQTFFNWYYFFTCLSLLIGLTVIVYIQSDISWGLGYLILTVGMVISILLFVLGSPFYNHVPIISSPYKGFAQVVVAAFRKRNLPLPSDLNELHNIEDKHEAMRLRYTNQLSFLNKAAIVAPGDLEDNTAIIREPWGLCTVHQVEECKSVIKLIPIWASGILVSGAAAQLGTFGVSQAIFMDLKIGHNFRMPSASLGSITLLTMILFIPIYDRIVLPVARHIRNNSRGISSLERIGAGIFVTAVSMVVGGIVEKKRRNAALQMKLITVCWLFPQAFLTGVAEAFFAIGQFEFFYEQLPLGMRSMSGALFWASSAIGSYISDLIIVIVQTQTSKGGGRNWLPSDINEGHLDYYYYLLGGLEFLNLIYYMGCARWYKYAEQVETAPLDESNGSLLHKGDVEDDAASKVS